MSGLVFSLFWLSSVAFCDCITNIVKKFTNLVSPVDEIFFFHGINASYLKQERWARVASQNTGFASYCPRVLAAV